MPARKQGNKKAPAPGPQRSSGTGLKVGLTSIVLVVLAFFYPTMILLAVAMLPTGVAMIVDRSPARMGWVCVGGLNLAGTIPALAELWSHGGTLEASVDILGQIFNLLVFYLSAAFGWLLYVSVPQMAALVTALTARTVIATLRARQKKLVDLWGPEVGRHPEVREN
ncbi:hypothetical protein IHV25_00865 [Phaeovibrio sulfidiphilus]|uniref:Uncharacterized protein n=1 Tax=Phaeovibrio sulfidiphilus TaxID=1220600 RepID=A0A8J6YKQ1_9PROT|nr:hypothetical protein [Phaeovibrio sulfidiphilus]MBE1236208.1 hypothetical protein [Phaeovibrio sulfidiphilus]